MGSELRKSRVRSPIALSSIVCFFASLNLMIIQETLIKFRVFSPNFSAIKQRFFHNFFASFLASDFNFKVF